PCCSSGGSRNRIPRRLAWSRFSWRPSRSSATCASWKPSPGSWREARRASRPGPSPARGLGGPQGPPLGSLFHELHLGPAHRLARVVLGLDLVGSLLDVHLGQR